MKSSHVSAAMATQPSSQPGTFTRRNIVILSAVFFGFHLSRSRASDVTSLASPSPHACEATPKATAAEQTASMAVASPVPIIVETTNQLTFSPAELTIAVGASVTWRNGSTFPHTATCDPEQNPLNATKPDLVQLPEGAKPWGSPMLQPGDEFSHVFDTPGSNRYICVPHVLSDMFGVITVEC